MERMNASHVDRELMELYDDYAHGRIERRDFLNHAAKYAVGGATAASILAAMSPNYALAEQVKKDDASIKAEYVDYDSPKGGKKMRGYLVMPAKVEKKLPAVLVVHENRGLNPYIEDVARRLAIKGFLALAPDALAPLGGYPGNDDKGRELQQKRKPEEMVEDFIAAAKLLKSHAQSNEKVGVVGFCYGGGVANTLAVRIPDVIVAAVPYYGRQPEAKNVSNIKGSLLIHYAELDKRINEGWERYETALKANKIDYTMHMYEGVNHGFHNDTTPRFDEKAAELSWKRTIEFFEKKLS